MLQMANIYSTGLTLAAIALFTSMGTSCRAQEAKVQDERSLIGRKFSGSAPDGVSPLGEYPPLVHNGIELSIKEGHYRGRRIIWINRRDGRDANGRLLLTITDVLRLPKLRAKEEVATRCVDGTQATKAKELPGIIGIVRLDKSVETKYTQQRWHVRLIRAWRIDPLTEHFVEVDTNSVECENTSWGM